MLKGAVIAFNDRRSTLPCTVRDLSATGARLDVPNAVHVPDSFVLTIELDGFEVDCQVSRRKVTELAVTFTASPRQVAPKRAQVVNPLSPRKPTLRRT